MTASSRILTVVKLLTPPILIRFLRASRRVLTGSGGFFDDDTVGKTLFDGDSAAFERIVASAKVYGEYGVGLSTDYVISHQDIPIVGVDTSKAWIDLVRARNADPERLRLAWVDVGPLAEWGRPISYTSRDRFRAYVESPWVGEEHPDVVLVDGRFRVACFLQSLLKAKPGTTIIFDDYMGRAKYHVVEEFVRPSEFSRRQAIFQVPDRLDRERIRVELERFIYVMD